MNSENFNPEKLYSKFLELWKNADELDRGQYTYYYSISQSLFALDMERALLLQYAINLCSFRDVDCNSINFNDTLLNMAWYNIVPNIRSNHKKWIDSKKGVEAKAAKNTKKNTKPKTKSNTKKITVKSSPVDSESIKQNVEVVDDTTQPENKDLSKENAVSLIHLKLNIDADLAIQIYNYRTFKKVSNTETALEIFCQQIKNGVDKSDVPIVGVVDYYCKGAWLEFKKTWVEDSIALANFADDIVAHENLEVVAPEVVAPVVDVADKTVSLILKHLPISRDYAENIVKFKKNYNQLDNDVSLLTWCREINKASDMAERPVNDVLDFIFMKNWKTFSAVWFVNHVTEETEAMKKKKYSDKVNPLTAPGLSHLSQGEKEKLIRDKRANNIRMGIPNRDDEDSSRVFREKGSNNLITMEQNNE